ncbi:MAG TPA: glucose-6-phosphate dehydrogenase [Gammaproteobacteria bacterium]
MIEIGDIDTCSIVIFGGTGDLATRMLLPSLYYLDRDGYLPARLRVIGAARHPMDDDAYRQTAYAKLREYIPDSEYDDAAWMRFADKLEYLPVDANKAEDFQALAKHLRITRQCELICYLSTAPKLYGMICRNLKKAGLVLPKTRVVLEKPIGHDLKSSRTINDAVSAIFAESNIFRIDHYLGKETVQNILALRFGNSIFEPLWNRANVDHVQITVAESVGAGGRWSYYNESGALRDMLQNHMLQLLTLIAMEPPREFDPDAVRNEKVKVLRSLRELKGRDVRDNAVRGQYAAGEVGGEPAPGYLQEEDAGADSRTETFVALRTYIDNWRWAGVPFYLRTGKRLAHRYSEVLIQFRQVPFSIFASSGVQPEKAGLQPNKLVIRLQPEENIKLLMMNKVPGLRQDGIELREVPLNLSLTEEFKRTRRRFAYERLFLDIIRHDTTLFVRRDEVEAAWSWADGILDTWKRSSSKPEPYAAGSWGPSSAFALIGGLGHTWHE